MTKIKDAFSRNLKRASIVNLNTGDVVDFLINPEVMDVSISANYSKLNSVGFPGKHQQYTGNENATIDIDAVFDDVVFNRGMLAFAQNLQSASSGINDVPVTIIPGEKTSADVWANRLQQFIYPRAIRSLLGGSPPITQFIWPGVVSMRVIVLQINYSYKMFYHSNSQTRILTASISMEEVPVKRLTSKNVKRHGFLRPGSTLSNGTSNGSR